MYLQVFSMEIDFISQLTTWIFITMLLIGRMNFTELPRLFSWKYRSFEFYHQLKWLFETNWVPHKGWDKRQIVTVGRIISIFSGITMCRCDAKIQEEGSNMVSLSSNRRKNDRDSTYMVRIRLTGIFSSMSTLHFYGNASLPITTNRLVFFYTSLKNAPGINISVTWSKRTIVTLDLVLFQMFAAETG